MTDASVLRSDDADEALAAVGAFLARRPVEHNILLTLLEERRRRTGPLRCWWSVRAGAVAAVALQTPADAPLGLSPADRADVHVLADGIADSWVDGEPELPGVTAEAATAAAFAGRWAERRRTPVVPRTAQRLHELRAVVPPPPRPGALRAARPDERDVLDTWFAGFAADTDHGPADHGGALDRLLADDQLWIWDHEGPRSMAALTTPAAGVVRVRYVYTPTAERGRGWAAACVAALSTRALATGLDRCALYTELTNPTSNALYARLGYRPVAEVLSFRFG